MRLQRDEEAPRVLGDVDAVDADELAASCVALADDALEGAVGAEPAERAPGAQGDPDAPALVHGEVLSVDDVTSGRL